MRPAPVRTGVAAALAAALCGSVLAETTLAAKIQIKSKRKKVESEGLDLECTGKRTKKFEGALFSISPMSRTVTVKQGDAKRTFRIAANCKISTPTKSDATLMDLKLGQKVQVAYFTTKLDTDVACSILPAGGDGSAKKKKKSD